MGSLTDYFCQHSFSSIMCYFVRVDRVDCYFGRSGCSDWKTTSVSFLYVTSCFRMEPHTPRLHPRAGGDNRMLWHFCSFSCTLSCLHQAATAPRERICTSLTTQGQSGWKSVFVFANLSYCWCLIGLINLSTQPLPNILQSLCCTPVPQVLHPQLSALVWGWCFSQSSGTDPKE